MSALLLITAAWMVEILVGWPNWIYKRIRHPVVWLGAFIAALDQSLNRETRTSAVRYALGTFAATLAIGLSIAIAWGLSVILPNNWWGHAIEVAIASSLIASRSLYSHVSAVCRPLMANDLDSARQAVSQIVGRDPTLLDEAGIARASLESLAENASDGVVAPVFWGAIFGLPGVAAYKAINTLDSMIGHRNSRYQLFGGFAARLDDLANLIPARITGILLSVASFSWSTFTVMLRDADKHRSPNAGWPEAAMAGGLSVRLSGPRAYSEHTSHEPWLNETARDPVASDLPRGLNLYRKAMGLGVMGLITFTLGLHYGS